MNVNLDDGGGGGGGEDVGCYWNGDGKRGLRDGGGCCDASK